MVPSEYDVEGSPISRELLEDGREHLVLGERLAFQCPVRLLHGLDDRDVPWEVSRRLLHALDTPDATLELVKGGDHRLSEPADLARLSRAIDGLLAGEPG